MIGAFQAGVLYRGLDPDARAYLAAVATADGQALETQVVVSVNEAVIALKRAGLWDKITGAYLLCGARTLTGAVKPLKAPVSPSHNFESGDYDRKEGLLGNGSSKYVETSIQTDAFPENSITLFCIGSVLPTSDNAPLLGAYVTDNSRLNDLAAYRTTPAVGRMTRCGANIGIYVAYYNASLTSSGSLCGAKTSATSLKLYSNGALVAQNTASITLVRSAATYQIFKVSTTYSIAKIQVAVIGSGMTDAEVASLHAIFTDLVAAYATYL